MPPKYLNPVLLEDIIREKERGYLGTVVNLFLYPRFIELCRRAIAETDAPERIESLEKMIESHEMTLRGETESLETWELLLPYLYSLRTTAPCTQPTPAVSAQTDLFTLITTPPSESSTPSPDAAPSAKS